MGRCGESARLCRGREHYAHCRADQEAVSGAFSASSFSGKGTPQLPGQGARIVKYLVTGNAGFIGFHVTRMLLARGDSVVGFDVVNDYYDPAVKEARLALLEQEAKSSAGDYVFVRADLADRDAVNRCFSEHKFDRVIHLAAQAGVRYSLENPHAYVESNIIAFTNIIEACRYAGTPHLTYASTSSVYGANTNMPFSEHRGVDHPL